MAEPARPHTVVVGAGISGLVAARRLAHSGARVTLVEASERLGGQVRTVDVAGHAVDVGAEALHLGSPGARAIVDELGLREQVVAARPGTSLVWTAGRLRPLPAGLGPAGPTRLRPVVTSRVLSAPGLGRASLEPLTARLRPGLAADADVSVGEFLAGRFGRELTDRLVDPLLGNLHGGDITQLSLRACAPSLLEAASRRRSILVGSRRGVAAGAGAPAFASFRGGLRVLTERLLADVAVEVSLGAAVVRLERYGRRLRLGLGDGRRLHADAVLLALPSAPAAGLLASAGPATARGLTGLQTTPVATVVLAFDRRATQELRAFHGTGLLVPSSAGLALKAMTHLSRKWPHLDDGSLTLVRLSVGRSGDSRWSVLDDEALVSLLLSELEQLTGLTTSPVAAHVERWHAGLPQLTVGHRARLRAVRDDLAHELPGVTLAGASYDGLGLPACIASGESGAAAVLTSLADPSHPQQAGSAA